VTIIVMLVLFTVFLVTGAPLAFAMGLSALMALVWQGQVPLVILPSAWYNSLDSFSLLAVPLFVFSGALMNVAGIAERIIAFALSLLGHVKGGLAQANILTNSFMAAISGSTAADVAAVGSVMIPAMTRQGYRPEFGVAVTACASMLASVFPPSIFMVIYGSLTGVSTSKLFMAGVIPGLLGAAGMMAVSYVTAEKWGGRVAERVPYPARLRRLRDAAPAIVMPVIILGGIFSGIFTPTEAGAVAVLYGLIVGTAFRRLSLAMLWHVVLDAAVLTGGALVILGGAALFSFVLVRGGAAELLLGALLGISQDPSVVRLIILAFLFLLGLVVEPVPGLILVMPILEPVVKAMHFDPLQFGVSVIMMLILGAVHPPVGMLGMIASRIAGVPFMSTIWATLPFMAIWIVLILAVSFVPALTTWLPYL
jgi:tripartite ATP-independent transporter DctM subunit